MPGQFQAEARRLGMDAMAAADGQRMLVFKGPFLQGGEHVVEVGQQQIRRLGQLHREAGVEHVRGGEPLMDEAAFRPDALGEPGQEGDHVVPGLALDLVDPLDVRRADGRQFGVAALANHRSRLGRDGADRRHRLAGEGLDFKPDPVAVFGRPDGGGLGAGIAGDHGGAPWAKTGSRNLPDRR